jgi:hypothetical protein
MSRDDPVAQLARENGLRLAREHYERTMEEEANKATAVRENMARLRELRLAKEAQEVPPEIAGATHPRKIETEKAVRVVGFIMIRHIEPGKWYFVVDCSRFQQAIPFAEALSPTDEPNPLQAQVSVCVYRKLKLGRSGREVRYVRMACDLMLPIR